MKTEVVLVGIRRGLTSEPVDAVYAHEVPILKLVRGSGSITVYEKNCTQFSLKPKDIKPRDELIRLKKKYRGFVADGENPVDVIFPDGSRDLELFYEDQNAFNLSVEPEGGGMLTDDEDTEAEEVEEVEEVETNVFNGINLLDREAVTGALDQMEVPYAKTTATKHLATLLTNSVEEGANTAEQPE